MHYFFFGLSVPPRKVKYARICAFSDLLLPLIRLCPYTEM